MINMHGAGLAGALMLAVPVLRMAFGANAPDALTATSRAAPLDAPLLPSRTTTLPDA